MFLLYKYKVIQYYWQRSEDNRFSKGSLEANFSSAKSRHKRNKSELLVSQHRLERSSVASFLQLLTAEVWLQSLTVGERRIVDNPLSLLPNTPQYLHGFLPLNYGYFNLMFKKWVDFVPIQQRLVCGTHASSFLYIRPWSIFHIKITATKSDDWL